MNKKINIKDLKPGTKVKIPLLVTNIVEKETRNKTAYCQVTLSDGETKMTANMWNTAKKDIEKYLETVVTANIETSLYDGQVSYVINYFLAAPDYCSIGDFIKKAPCDSKEMYDEILNLATGGNEDTSLKKVVKYLYEQNKEKLFYWSAAKSVHHNLYGGLLYHTYRMMYAGQYLCDVYSSLNREVLLAAIALHDIGKLIELETSPLGEAEYTIDGNLEGHLLIGHDMFLTAVYELAISWDEQLRLLDHCILSHHGKLEYGAIKQPSIPEAMLLHYLDQIDARMYQFEEILTGLEPGSFSDTKFTLDGVKVYRSN